MYERAMEEFAVDQLFKERIDGALAVLYRKLIYPELIDTQMARVLPGILKSCRVECREPAMKYVVVRHEEQMTEDAYVLNEGTAYVPLFSERDLVLFQDENETRYARVNCAIQPVFTDMEELLQTCFEMNPMHPFLFMNACAKACRKEVLTGDDAILLEHADQKMELHPLFRAKVLSAIVRYYKRMADGIEDAKKDGSVSYLLSLDKDQLTRDERNGVCGTLIRCGHFSEAYEMVCRYGLEGLPVNLLLRLCGRMLLQNLFDRDDHLLYLTWYVFEHEKPDSVILDYLCEHFNGTVDQMYRVLMQGAAAPGGDVRSGGTAGGADALYRQYSKVRPGVRALCVTQENRGKYRARVFHGQERGIFSGKPSDGRQGVRIFGGCCAGKLGSGADPGYLSAGADKVLCDAAGAFGGTAAPVPVGGGCAFRCGHDFCLF